ncbi:restriction endonuclease subunit S [Streptomyces hirsutus]|uniref:restriction endonuclease subunit S n=1 Tax=Streptomyces hirsutus TaxID=35620 RepID=UPI0033C4A493
MNTSVFEPRSLKLPNSYELVRLGYVARLQNGLTVDAKRDITGDVVTRPYLRVANVQAGSLSLESVTEITVPRSVARRSTLRPGDVLMTEGGDLDKLGRGTVWQGELEGCLHQNHIFAIRPDPQRLNGRFLAYLTQSLYGRSYFESTGTRTTNLASTNSNKIQSFPLPLPPLEEQRRIADFLDTETARIDQSVRARNTQAEKLTERDYAVISETLIPGILNNPQGTGRAVFPWLPNIPTDRPLVRLGYVCRLQNGLTVDGKRDVTGDVVTRPYLRVANVQAGRLALDSVTEITVPRAVANRSTLRPGDVLMTEGGDLDKLGRGAMWNDELPQCLHQNHVFALRPDRSVLDGRYLTLMTQTLHGRCYFESTGTKTTNLASTNSSKILGFPIPLPSVNAQRSLVAEVHEKIQSTATVRHRLNGQVALLTERRQTLITAAVTGQFDVSTASGCNVTEGVAV